MGSKFCMNLSCRTTTAHEWKKGWSLRSGGFADLCHTCGFAYENSVYCDMFHLAESGWRECTMCGKKIHCGCIASVFMFENLDFGGIACTRCLKHPQPHLIQSGQTCSNGFNALTLSNMGCPRSPFVENTLVNNRADDGKLVQLCKIAEVDETRLLSQSQVGDALASGRRLNGEGASPTEDARKGFSGATQRSSGTSQFSRPENDRLKLEIKDMHDSVAQPSLRIGLGTPSRTPNFLQPSVEIKEESKVPSSFQQGQRSRPILPKPPKAGSATNSETNKSSASHIRVARPPGEGRGKNQLLPRYWPRITDQELQQLSGDLNSTIVPLFEKVLSASDAGRIGRLVLPKACAEAYFPPISQSEGVPVKIQDVKGKEWTFQFRFWPNNNSRMYVLEGVTPCIQSMQLQAGDTVIFSRLDPGGKLVMGFRKSLNSTDMQDSQTAVLPNGRKDSLPNSLPERSSSADDDVWHRSENNGSRSNDDSRPLSVPNSEKKRTRNIGPKNKRLLMNSEEALELRLTWEEAQDLLRPPPSARPSIFIVEDLEFEEYDEPPVFGKRTIFTARPSGEQEQWAQCDDCFKWRRLPVDVLLPPKWTCAENVWDLSRSSCSAPDDLGPKELDQLSRVNKDFKRRKIMDNHKTHQDHEPSGLDALASAAVLGESIGDAGEPSVGATTKHPRHRPGCTCIVCIQPPSGKGKHKPTCICNVCMTVKRRFKTLMLRKKKRQEAEEMAQREHNEREEADQKDDNERDEMTQKDHKDKDDSEINDPSNVAPPNHAEIESSQDMIQPEVLESSGGQIDLNCHPEREDMHAREDRNTNISVVSTMSLVQAATVPLENYMLQNGVSSLGDGEQASSSAGILPSPGAGKKDLPVEGCPSSSASEHGTKSDEEDCEPDSK